MHKYTQAPHLCFLDIQFLQYNFIRIDYIYSNCVARLGGVRTHLWEYVLAWA